MFSITKELREYGHDCCARIDDAINELADHIEQELAERYTELPLDADGVPWYRGSKVKDLDGEVRTVWIAGDNTLVTDDHRFLFPANSYRHYQPDTWERIIDDAVAAGRCEKAVNVMPLIARCKALAKEQS